MCGKEGFLGVGMGVKTEDSRTTALGDVELTTVTSLILWTLLTGSGAGLAELLEGTLFLLEASTELIGCERKGMSQKELWQAFVTEKEEGIGTTLKPPGSFDV